ncbi:MAG: hypothetical protein EHM72_18940, partial [Calditrichaeota bacterium]
MKPLALGLFILFSCLNGVDLVDAPRVSQGEITFYLDLAYFVGEADHAYVEFYLMLFADQFARHENGDNSCVTLKLSSEIIDKSGVTVSAASWTTQAMIAKGKPENLSTLAIYDQWTEQLKPGEYCLKVCV